MGPFRFDCPVPLAARGFALGPETADHLPFLRWLFTWQRRAEMALLPWDDTQKVAFLGSQFEMQHRHYRTHFPDAQFLVLSEATGPVGRLYLARDGRGLRVVDILLHPERRGHGLGGALLAGLLDTAGVSGLGVSLQVDKGNPAQALYQRLGFAVTGDTGVSWRMDWSPEKTV